MSTAKTFAKHISFDDLAPSLIDDQATIIKNDSHHVGLNNHFLHIPPQFNPVYRNSLTGSQGSSELTGDENLDSSEVEGASPPARVESPTFTAPGVPQLYTQMFSPAAHDPSKSYLRSPSNERSRSESPMFRSRRRASVRLPPPPKISVLKRSLKAADGQGTIEDIDIGDLDFDVERKMTKMTERNTQKNSGSRKGYTQAAFANLNEVEDRIETKSMVDLSETENSENSKKRSKSFAGMTDEELTKLEEFYISKGRSNKTKIDQFDFSEQLPVYMDTTVSKTDSENVTDPLAAIYPSRPTIVHNAISMTIDHPHYESYVSKIKDKLNCKEKNDEVDLRVVSCYISGRRYTWSSVDWYVENLARDGDHLVIITTIPEFEAKIDTLAYKEKRKHRLERMTSDTSESMTMASHNLASPDTSSSLSIGMRIEAIHNEAKQTCCDILNYYAKRLATKTVRISIEMVKEDSTRSAIICATSLYVPSLQIISTVSANIQIKFRNGKVKLPFFLMKHFAMPAFVVPFEFIKPQLLIKPKTDKTDSEDKEEGVDDLKTKVKKEERSQWLSELIKRTLENPFTKHRVVDSDNNESDSDESVASINEYFPISPEKKQEMEFFDKMGYVRPKPSRQVLLDDNTLMKYDSSGRKLTPVESKTSRRSSKRSSRIQFNNNGIYKVKSMVDDIYNNDAASTPHAKTALKWDNEDPKSKFTSHPMRKTKSAGLSPRTSSTSSHSGQRKSHHHHHHHSRVSRTKTAESSKSANSKKGSSSSSTSELQVKKDGKKKKSKFGSIFKKVFG